MTRLDAQVDLIRHVAQRARSHPLRVLMLHRDLAYDGGVPRCFLSFAENNRSGRFSLTVASFEPAALEMRSALEQLGVTTACIGDGGYIRPALRLRRLLRTREIEVVVATSFKAYVVAKMAALGTGTPVVFWMHAAQSVLIQGWRRALFRCLSQDDALISVSRAVLKSHDHWSHRGIHEVVYNGVKDPMGQADLQPYKRSMRAALGIPDDAWVLCYVASFVPWKDHQTLLEAFERLDRERLRAHLVLIGTGPLEAGLRKAVQDKPYAKCVHFLGARPDARRLLGIADAYVHTCREEGFGLAVVEAMLAGRPVIAPRSGAPAEYITDHWNGLLFEPGNPVDLADRINELASDHAAAMRMAELGRMVCLQKFSPQRFYEGVGEVIEQAVRAYRAEVPEIDAEFLGHA